MSTTSSARTETAHFAAVRAENRGVRTLVFVRDRGIIALWLVLVAVFAVWAAPYFFTLTNAALVANAAALTAVFAAAVAFGVLSGALDLSIPGTAAMSAVVAALAIKAGAPGWLGIVIAIVVGALLGWVNGALVLRGLNPLVVTIGSLTVLTGLAQVVSGGSAVTGIQQLTWLGRQAYFGIPGPVYAVAILYLLGWLFLTQTRAGTRMLGVGANIEAVRRAGIPANRYRVLGFVLSGATAAVGGVLVMASTTQASPNGSVNLLFTALTAVALSGMPLIGGRGSLPRVLVGALVIETISSALVIRGIAPYWATVATGTLLVLALAFELVLSRAVARRLASPTRASFESTESSAAPADPKETP